MILLESGKEHSTPTAYRKAADRIEERFGRPVVFYFDNLVYYQRKRLVEHGVYFICGERDVFLPMLLASPVKERFYCTCLPDGHFPASGISALSIYSHLAPDSEQTIAAYAKDWKKEQFENLNTFEGPYIVEFWRYPAAGAKSVDKLSLYLALENDPDPRVHKELEFVFESVWKKS